MSTDQELEAAIHVLWDASEHGQIEKVIDRAEGNTETYLMADMIAYTDPLYISALERLISDKRLICLEKQKDRKIFAD